MTEQNPKLKELTDTFLTRIDDPSNPAKEDLEAILPRISTADLDVLELGKEIILEAYKEECDKAKIIEQRAYQMIQFSKIGLTIIFGISTFISTLSNHHTEFKISLFTVMLIAAIFLVKALYRGAAVMHVGTIFRPTAEHVKLNQLDLFEIQNLNYVNSLKLHTANLLVYFDNTSKHNVDRTFDCKCCWINIVAFMCAFFVFFGLCFMHILYPELSKSILIHPLLGVGLGLAALIFDTALSKCGLPFLRREELKARY